MQMTDDLERALNVAFPTERDDIPVLKTIKARALLIYSALQAGAIINKAEFDLSIDDLHVFIDNCDQQIITDVYKDFMQSRYMGQSVEDYLFVSETTEDAPAKKSQQES